MEIPLEDKELCNLAETCPTRCPDRDTWLQACKYATFYASTVSLLPTHWECTNKIVNRNRRIGVGIIDYTGWLEEAGAFHVTSCLKKGYKTVRKTNRMLAAEAGVPESIRVTTMKPGGTIPKLVGRTSGAGYATFKYVLRRMRVAHNNPIVPILMEANIPHEVCVHDPKTLIFGFPVNSLAKRTAEDVSLWQQACNLVHLQHWWSDNAVSNTLYFKPKWLLKMANIHRKELLEVVGEKLKLDDSEQVMLFNGLEDLPDGYFQLTETVKIDKQYGLFNLYHYNPQHEEDDIKAVLSYIIPHIKACSLLPHSPKGAYAQMPEEGLTEEQYLQMKSTIKPINWDNFHGSDGEDEKYCQGGICSI